MMLRSLRSRLLAAALVSVSLAVLIAGLSFIYIFEYHVERRISLELDTLLNQITASLSLPANGHVTFNRHLLDPRFDEPLSGLYWQIQDEGSTRLLRSRSLWDELIELPDDQLASGVIHQHRLPGPGKQQLLVRERQVILSPNRNPTTVRIAVATDLRNVIQARNEFAADILPYLVVITLLLLAAAWVQVGIGLSPLNDVRQAAMAIKSGQQQELSGRFPIEVKPLVDEINGLLNDQRASIERAKSWTADLAHGLKTPLSMLTAEAHELREQGNPDTADNLEQLAENMRKRVDRELIRARMRSGLGQSRAVASLNKQINGIARALQRTPEGSKLVWQIDLKHEYEVRIQPEDLSELLGNILENAVTWAAGQIHIHTTDADQTEVIIEDDGPGVANEYLDQLGLRGLRLDEQKQGTGLGLAIALDITQAYDGQIHFSRSKLGGLQVIIRLPLANRNRVG